MKKTQKLSQKDLDELMERDNHFYREMICSIASDVESFSVETDTVKLFTNRILKDYGISPHAFLRRDKDGVSEACWMIQKMIGEFLIFGKVET